MKVLHIIPHVGPGGAERFVLDLCTALSPDCSVVLVCLFSDPTLTQRVAELPASVRVIMLGKRRGFDPSMYKKLWGVLAQERPDVVNSHLAAVNYVAPITPFFPSIRFFHTVHNDGFREARTAKERLFRWFFYRTRRIAPIAISTHSAATFQEAYRGVRPKLIVNGRRPLELPLPDAPAKGVVTSARVTPQTRVIVNLGRLAPQKNQLLLCKAFTLLLNEGFDLALLIIGASSEGESALIAEEIRELHCDRIHVLGERRDAADFLYESDLFALSSTFEGMPISLIEAFCAGCVPVCTPVGGVTEMISHGENGFLSADVSVEGMQEALRQALNSPNRATVRQACRDTFSAKYHIATTARNYQRIYGRKPAGTSTSSGS